MSTLPNSKRISSRWVVTGAAIALAGAAAFVPAYYARKKGDPQEKESSRVATADQTTTLNDQTDLAVTVYNSNIALVRDVRQLQLPSGGFRLKFMDIAATVNPATVHFRSLTDPEKAQRHRAELRIRFAGARQAAEQICRQGSDPGPHVHGQQHHEAGGDQGHLARQQQRSCLAHRQRHCHGSLCRELSLPGSAGQSIRAAHAVDVAGEFRRAQAEH